MTMKRVLPGGCGEGWVQLGVQTAAPSRSVPAIVLSVPANVAPVWRIAPATRPAALTLERKRWPDPVGLARPSRQTVHERHHAPPPVSAHRPKLPRLSPRDIATAPTSSTSISAATSSGRPVESARMLRMPYGGQSLRRGDLFGRLSGPGGARSGERRHRGEGPRTIDRVLVGGLDDAFAGRGRLFLDVPPIGHSG